MLMGNLNEEILISRQASIDALKKHFSDDDIMINTECGAYWHHGHVIEVLQGMPSVTEKSNKYRKEAKRWKNKWLRLKSQKSKTGHCKDCKWWKDSDGAFRRGVGAESQCPINREEVYEGNGYCYIFEPQERSE